MLSCKYRIYPSFKQLLRLGNQFALAQELYNALLQICKDHYKQTGKTMTKYSLNKHIKEIKESDERFKTLHSQVLQNISDRIVKAYQAFFRRVKEKRQGKNVEVGFPRFKKFYKSITYPQSGFRFKNQRRLHLSKMGSIPIVLHRPIKGTVKTMTIKRMRSSKWYVCFSVENSNDKADGKTVKHLYADKQVGIDVGIEWFASLSDGSHIENPRCLVESERRLKRLQRRLSRKTKGSNNRRKARIKVARMHEKIADQRMDFLHKLSRDIIGKHGLVAVEQLNINGMVHNHHLAKHINDASWNSFIQMLCYKAENAGGTVVMVNPSGTSQICSNCGTDVPKDLGVRTHKCPECGFEVQRDVNSALNILDRAIKSPPGHKSKIESTAGRAESHACGDRVRPLSQTSSGKKASVVEAGTICGI